MISARHNAMHTYTYKRTHTHTHTHITLMTFRHDEILERNYLLVDELLHTVQCLGIAERTLP